MDPRDRELGMGRAISRRDFLSGAAGTLVAGAALATGCPQGAAPPPAGPVGATGAPPPPAGHPPSRLGLRGSQPGSFEAAHRLAWEGKRDWGPAAEPDDGEYDLVVVGAGVSGLAAAWFHRERHPDARILLLENHDDFGGHARRNEFAWNGRTLVCHGGSQSLEAPGAYSEVSRGLLRRIGVEPERLRAAYDEDFYRRHGLATGIFFDREHYGSDRLVVADWIDPSAFLPVARSGRSLDDVIDELPLSGEARSELLALTYASDDRLPDHSLLAEPGFLESISYRDFLTQHLGVRTPEVLTLLQEVPAVYFGHGIDATSALECLAFGLPGLGATSLGRFEGILRRAMAWAWEPYLYHFPDGNASVARQLVRGLIPEVAAGGTMEDLVTAEFDYAALDRADSQVRLRLESSVVRVEHEGDHRTAERVHVTYVRGGRAERVRARRVVLACWNMVIPHLCPELPEPQRTALASLVKTPLVFTSVLLRDWRAFEKLGIGFVYAPHGWHRIIMLDFPVSLGGYAYSSSPDEPVALHLARSVSFGGGTPQERSRRGRHLLLATSFEDFERDIRRQLGGMLSGGGFDPARDIEGITVNRWPHGYAFTPSALFDPEYAEGEAPHEIGRRRFGRIAIANSDAGARAYLDEAIDQAWRAVDELG